MVFDRISLVKAYGALKIVELNDGAVKDILFNKTSYYGTKTIDRFDRLSDLAAFINENYPYQYLYGQILSNSFYNQNLLRNIHIHYHNLQDDEIFLF